MKIVGSSKQDGIPSPDNQVQITNETVVIITDKEGNKKEMPFKYEKILKEGDKIEKINGEWCLVRKKPMNDIEILENKLKQLCKSGKRIKIEDMKTIYAICETIQNLIQRNKDLEQIEKEHKEENGRLREEIEKYKSLLAKSTANRVVTSIKDNKKSNEDLEMLNEGWKIKLKEKIEEYKKIKNEPIRYTKVERPDKAIHNLDYCIAQNIIRVLQELLEESDK